MAIPNYTPIPVETDKYHALKVKVIHFEYNPNEYRECIQWLNTLTALELLKVELIAHRYDCPSMANRAYHHGMGNAGEDYHNLSDLK